MNGTVRTPSLYEQDGENNGWLSMLTDVMMLMIVFFVLLFTLADTQESHSEGAQIEHVSVLAHEDQQVVTLPDPQRASASQQMRGLQAELDSLLRAKNISGVTVTPIAANRLMIRLDGSVYFASGSTWVADEMFDVLDTLLPVIKSHEELNINIQGHTDNQPVHGERFKNNWDLSVLRATETLEYFVHYGISSARLSASGYGDALPVASNDTPGGRARNRRVEIILEHPPSSETDLPFPHGNTG